MNFSKFNYLIYPFILSVTFAYMITGIIDYIYKPILPISSNSNNKINKNKVQFVNKKIIFEKNILNLEKNDSTKIANNPDSINNYDDISTNNVYLIGILKNDKKAYGVIKYNDKLYILEQGIKKKGLLLKNIEKNKVTIEANGKIINLKFKKSNNKIYSSNTKPITSNNDNIALKNNKVSIPRTTLLNELKDVNKVLKSVFVSPYYKSGEFVGYRISRLRRNSILKKIGLRNGDIIVNINGEELSTPEKLFELFGKAEELNAITIDLIRRSQKETIFVEITE